MMIEKWKFLPEGILMDILTWLPVKCVVRFRFVSKNWCSHFTNPDFIKLHATHSDQMNHLSFILKNQEFNLYESSSASFPSLDYSISAITGDVTFDMSVEYRFPFHYSKLYLEIIGTCNGLLCLLPDPEVFCIWNPITKENKKLPEVPEIRNLFEPIGYVPREGFGYDCKTGVYKVVKIVTVGGDVFSQVTVYTLGTDSWRVLEKIPYVFNLRLANGVSLNGSLHWLAHPTDPSEGVSRPTRIILSFDVGSEKFKEMQLPIPMCGASEGRNYYKISLGLLDGKLCLFQNFGDGNVDVWVMKNYGVAESWTKLFSISRLTEDIKLLRPVQSLKNGDILLFAEPFYQSIPYNGDLILYNPMNGNARFLDTSSCQTLNDAHPYVGTLLSVKSICNTGQEDVEQAILH